MLSVSIIKSYIQRGEKAKNAIEFKTVGRELRDTYGLTDRQALDILNSKTDKILDILEEQEQKMQEGNGKC